MRNNNLLQTVYSFFVGVLLVLFVGVGISAFYTAPKAPTYPTELNTLGKEPTSAQIAQEREFEAKMRQHDEIMKPYNRNVSVMTLAAAVIFLVISLVYEKRIKILADGVLLGGLFTLIYSIGRGFASENNKYVFAIVTVSLAIVLFQGYHRFVRGTTLSKKLSEK